MVFKIDIDGKYYIFSHQNTIYKAKKLKYGWGLSHEGFEMLFEDFSTLVWYLCEESDSWITV